MDPSSIITLLTSLITGIAKVSSVTREALASSLEDMAKDVREGGLLPDELFEKSEKDSGRLSDIYEGLKD